VHGPNIVARRGRYGNPSEGSEWAAGASPRRVGAVDELTARRARSFGPVAAMYDRVRPGYPPDGVSWVLERAAGARGARDKLRVVELGAGTGSLTRDLVARGHEVIAVEPDPHMRAVLEERVPGADVRAGQAEDLPVDDGGVDVVVGAQMWHWVQLEAAAVEVARVLRPGGTLGLMWNLRDEGVAWMAELGAVFGGDDVHRGAANVHLPPGAAFTATAARDFRWSQELAPDDMVDLVATRSHVRVMGAEERERLLGRVTEFVASHPAVAGRGRIVVPYVTSCWRATRT